MNKSRCGININETETQQNKFTNFNIKWPMQQKQTSGGHHTCFNWNEKESKLDNFIQQLVQISCVS